MKAQEEPFYSQFEGKNVDSFTVVKSTPSADNEIEAISGSTITSKAMANGDAWYVSDTCCHILRNQRTWHGTFHNSGTGTFQYADFRIP